MTSKKDAELTVDRAIVDEAVAKGFMQCRAIRDGLGWDKPGPNGTYYSSMQVAYRWIEDAGEQVVYLIPDGPTDVTKGERTGCWPDVFVRVLAYKNAVYAKRWHDEWTRNMASAVEAREQYGAQTKLHGLGRLHRRAGAGAAHARCRPCWQGRARAARGRQSRRLRPLRKNASFRRHAGVHRPAEQDAARIPRASSWGCAARPSASCGIGAER